MARNTNEISAHRLHCITLLLKPAAQDTQLKVNLQEQFVFQIDNWSNVIPIKIELTITQIKIHGK